MEEEKIDTSGYQLEHLHTFIKKTGKPPEIAKKLEHAGMAFLKTASPNLPVSEIREHIFLLKRLSEVFAAM